MPSSSLRAPSLPQGLKQEGVRGDVYLDQRWPTPTATARGLESRALDPCYSVSMLPPPRGSRAEKAHPPGRGYCTGSHSPGNPAIPPALGCCMKGWHPWAGGGG